MEKERKETVMKSGSEIKKTKLNPDPQVDIDRGDGGNDGGGTLVIDTIGDPTGGGKRRKGDTRHDRGNPGRN